MKRWLMVTLAAISGWGTTAWAGTEKGDEEHDLLFGVGCTRVDEELREGHTTDYLMYYGYGRFLEDWLSVGLRIGGGYIDDGNTSTEGAFSVGPYVKVSFFASGDLVPYLAGQVAYWYQRTNYPRPRGRHENQGMMYGPLVGLKYYLDEGTYLTAEYQWRWYGCDIGKIADYSSMGLIGFGFTF